MSPLFSKNLYFFLHAHRLCHQRNRDRIKKKSIPFFPNGGQSTHNEIEISMCAWRSWMDAAPQGAFVVISYILIKEVLCNALHEVSFKSF